jgi:hypothetical protein
MYGIRPYLLERRVFCGLQFYAEQTDDPGANGNLRGCVCPDGYQGPNARGDRYRELRVLAAIGDGLVSEIVAHVMHATKLYVLVKW